MTQHDEEVDHLRRGLDLFRAAFALAQEEAERAAVEVRRLKQALLAATVEAETAKAEIERARGYLIRNILTPLWPAIKPQDTLFGVCTQVNNGTTGFMAGLVPK